MRISAFIAILMLAVFSAVSQQEKVNTLYLKTDNIPDRVVAVNPVDELCMVDSAGNIRMVFEGKLSEKNVRLTVCLKNKKGATKIKTDADGDLRPEQKADVEIFGNNPAVDKTTYAVEDEKDEAIITILSYNQTTGKIEGHFSSRYWDSATNSRRLSASIKFSTILRNS
jgi:hypothetical protein